MNAHKVGKTLGSDTTEMFLSHILMYLSDLNLTDSFPKIMHNESLFQLAILLTNAVNEVLANITVVDSLIPLSGFSTI